MTDWAELAGMWATAGQPGTPLSTIETFATWLDKHDAEVRAAKPWLEAARADKDVQRANYDLYGHWLGQVDLNALHDIAKANGGNLEDILESVIVELDRRRTAMGDG